MFFQTLKQSFLRGRRRKGLAVLTIFLAATLFTTLLILSVDVGDKMARELKSYGANIQVLPKSERIPLEIGGVDYNPLKGRSFLKESELPKIKDIFWRNNIVGLAPVLKAVVDVEGGDGSSVPLIGTYFDKHMPVPDEDDYRTGVTVISGFWEVEGRWPDDDKPAEVLAGAALARAAGLDIGGRVRIGVPGEGHAPQTVTVVGILRTGGVEEDAIVAPLALAQALTGHAGKVQSVSVSALTVPENHLSRQAHRNPDALDSLEYDLWYCTAYVSSIAHQIEEAVTNATAQPVWQVAASEGVVIERIQLLMLVVTVAAFIASGLGISSLMSTTIMERAREIGLMKALGAAEWEVYALFLSEAAGVGVLGGLLGFVAGSGLAQVIGLMVFDSLLTVPPVVVLVVVVLSVLIALAGSVMPSRLIAQLQPVEVLHGQR